jgi:hypothetical protein
LFDLWASISCCSLVADWEGRNESSGYIFVLNGIVNYVSLLVAMNFLKIIVKNQIGFA